MQGGNPVQNMLKRVFQARALTDREAYYKGIVKDEKMASESHGMKPKLTGLSSLSVGSPPRPRVLFRRTLMVSLAHQVRSGSHPDDYLT